MTMLSATREWLVNRTWQHVDWTIADLIAAKNGRTVSVVMPALNEEATVANVIASVKPLVGNLVDELIVLDSGSTDRTMEISAKAGAKAVLRSDVLPGWEPLPGKGEVLWRSLAVATGDIIVFIDSDLFDPDPMFVPSLLGPILMTPAVHLVKGFYRRPLTVEGGPMQQTGGGRVTELLARPLISALRPELSGVIQPLGGEYAATREFLSSIPFATNYGVEIGVLFDAHSRYGLGGIAQVNLGIRIHRNRPLLQLGVMSRQILSTALRRCGLPDADHGSLTQFVEVDDEWVPDVHEVRIADRPPMRDVLLRETARNRLASYLE
jgi:glucosyl-3-phosphoglycerate synthase